MMSNGLPRRLPSLLAMTLLATGLASCDRRRVAGPVVVSAIGGAPRLADPARGSPDMPARLLLDSCAEGLVRFDASGQIEPGLAERWIVIDGGMTYIFRLRETEWSDGRRVTADEVVGALRRQVAPRSRNRLLPFLSAIAEIVEMTPEVIEVRLKRPRPDLLKLFAAPELAVLRLHPAGGGGPYRILRGSGHSVVLRPGFDPARSDDDAPIEPDADATIDLIGERAARAIVRFSRAQSDLVSGGSFDDWPLVTSSDVAPANRRIDPAAGLFGLAVTDRRGFLADVSARAAVARAIDRNALVSAFAVNWTATTKVLPDQLDSTRPPAQPDWASPGAPDPRAVADRWRQTHGASPRVRIALPPGPGATILFGLVGGRLGAAGIEVERVGPNDAADLRLIDLVAPYDSARWYLANACQPCSSAAETALAAARDAVDPAVRAGDIADADAAIAADISFIPLANPLRWSLVSLRLTGWQGNSRAWHPLNHLR